MEKLSKAAKRRQRRMRLLEKLSEVDAIKSPEKARDQNTKNPKLDANLERIKSLGKLNAIKKYYFQRHSLFVSYEGKNLNWPAWFSVTPYQLSKYIAEKFSVCECVVDLYCGVGGNTVEFCKNPDIKSIIAVDKCPESVEFCRLNCNSEKLTLVLGDCLDFLQSKTTSIPTSTGVFMSPPWGGINYRQSKITIQNLNCEGIINNVLQRGYKLAVFLPWNIQLDSLRAFNQDYHVQYCFLDDIAKGILVWFGFGNIFAEQNV
jgi:trimethylguanosine synthase